MHLVDRQVCIHHSGSGICDGGFVDVGCGYQGAQCDVASGAVQRTVQMPCLALCYSLVINQGKASDPNLHVWEEGQQLRWVCSPMM